MSCYTDGSSMFVAQKFISEGLYRGGKGGGAALNCVASIVVELTEIQQ